MQNKVRDYKTKVKYTVQTVFMYFLLLKGLCKGNFKCKDGNARYITVSIETII